ncbi:MAG: fluoride efflux transporter CrcB [Coprobacillus sp.]
MNKFLLVGLGGALGAMLRYGLTFLPLKSTFPFSTFITNILGAIFVGFVVGLFDKGHMSEDISLFLKTGFCGGFTTFSTFSLESVQLLENKKILLGMGYILLSLTFCLCGIIVGKLLGQKVGM